MKRNLSKNTAKALAVGLAVGLGSSAAISGVNSLVGVSAAVPVIQGDVAYDAANNKVILTFDQSLQVANNGNVAGFSIIDDSNNTVTGIITNQAIVENTKIELTLSSTINPGTYKVKYEKGTNDAIVDANATTDEIADFTTTGTFTVTAPNVATAPIVSSATIENDAPSIIKVTFDKEIAITGTNISSLFTVKKGANAETITAAAIDANDSKVINITLSSNAQSGETYTISYTAGANDFITDKTETTLKVENFEDKEVENKVVANDSGDNSELETGAIFNAGGFKFEVLDKASKKVTLLGKKEGQTSKEQPVEFEGATIENGKIKKGELVYTITQIGKDSALTGAFTVEELDKLCAEATIIETKAFDGVDVTGGTSIKLPKVAEVKANSLAFKSGITKVELPAIKDATKIDANAFKATNGSTTVSTVAVDKAIKENVKLDSIKVEAITETTTNKPNNSTTTTTKPNNGSASGAIINSAGQIQSTTTEGSTETTTQYVTKNLSLDKVNLPAISDASKSFADVVASHWASSAISRLASAGIINGMPDGSFNLNGNTKRADMAVMLIRLLGLNETFSGNFSDVPESAYYANAVGLAREYGIVTGSTDGRFNPNQNISRQDTMVMIARILQNLNINVNTDTSVLSKFSDSSSVSGYALEGVAILVNAGIINGNNGNINPKAPITRAEIAVIMDKLYDVINEGKKAGVATTTETTTESTTTSESTTKGSTETTTEGSTETTTTN